MGLYINNINGIAPPENGKVIFILQNVLGSKIIPQPTEFVENLVCVVDNRPYDTFDAAAYAYSEAEMNHFKRPDDRKKTWLIVPGAKYLAE